MVNKSKVFNIISFSALMFLGIYIGAFQRLLYEISYEFSFTTVAMGLIITTHFTGFFVGTIVSGELSDKYGRKIIILCSFFAFLLGLILIFGSFNMTLIFVGVFLGGAGFGVSEGAITTLLTDAAPEESNKIISISQIFSGIGAAAGPFIAMAFVGFIGMWKYFYGVCIVIVVILIILFWKFSHQGQIVNEKLNGIITLKLLRKRTFLIFLLSMIMYVGIEEGIAFWITSYIKEWSMINYFPSLALSVFWGGMIVGRYFVSKFSKRLNELLIISSSVFLLFLFTTLFSNSSISIMISFFGMGLSISGMWPILMALARIRFPKYAGTALGIMMSGCAVGGVVIPLVMGYIAKVVSMKYALAFCSIPAVIIIINQILIKYDNTLKKNRLKKHIQKVQ